MRFTGRVPVVPGPGGIHEPAAGERSQIIECVACRHSRPVGATHVERVEDGSWVALCDDFRACNQRSAELVTS